MKKNIFFVLLSLFFGCKNTSEKLSTLKGSYIFFEDAAVLQTMDEIYGVYLNEKAIELNKMAKTTKSESTDVVMVELKGHISSEKHEIILWEKKFEIVEIVELRAMKETKNTVILGVK